MISSELIARHRGPFQLVGKRRGLKGYESCKLADSVSRDEVISLAETFLTDPRDTLTAVYVWAGIEPYCIGWMTLEERMREEQDK